MDNKLKLTKFINKNSLNDDINVNEEDIEVTSVKDIRHEDFLRSTENSYIGTDMVIDGDIKSIGNLKLDGTVNGNVECDSTLEIKGDIKGHLQANTLVINKSSIEGNLVCGENCHILSNTSIKGDINAKNVIVDGAVDGNITAEESISVSSGAYIKGNCSTNRIAIEDGALINGQINTSKGV